MYKSLSWGINNQYWTGLKCVSFIEKLNFVKFRMVVLSSSVCPWQAFSTGLTFVSKAKGLP
jgi:hypothetical protein